MMIEGVGTDILDLDRIRTLLSGKNRTRFLDRVLTPAERERAQGLQNSEQRLVEFVAGRFALKEAVAKAFGCGIGRMVSFQDIEIKASPSGKPQCAMTVGALNRLNAAGEITIHVSVSHSEKQVVAFAVAEKSVIS